MKFWLSRLTLSVAAMSVVCLSGIPLAGQAGTPVKGQTAGEVFKNVTTSPLKGPDGRRFYGKHGRHGRRPGL